MRSGARLLARPLALVALASAAGLGWLLRRELVVLFCAVLFGTALYRAARWVAGRTRLSHGLAVVALYTLALSLLMGFFALAGQRFSSEYGELGERIPDALENVEERLAGVPVLGSVSEDIRDLRRSLQSSADQEAASSEDQEEAKANARRLVRITLRAMGDAALVLILTFYIAYDGRRYVRGVLRLVPPDHLDAGEDLAAELGAALPLWLVGRLTSMAVVALLTALGLFLLGMPVALALALIAGAFAFVPVLGPIAAVIPALLVTLESAPDKLVWVLALYGAVQFLESWIITPRIQDQVASTPPLLLLSAQFTMGVLVGTVGVMFSTPLVLAAMVTVQVLYLRHGLGQDADAAGHG